MKMAEIAAVMVIFIVIGAMVCYYELESFSARKIVSRRTVSGVVQGTHIWSGEILIVDHVEVPQGATLIIEPGTIVMFKHYRGYKEPWKRLGVNVVGGVLKAIGTPEKQIWFTSDADEPINGDWAMIRIVDDSDYSIFKYCIVECALQGINIWHSSPTISHSIVRWCNWEGIYMESYSAPLIECCMIYENGYNGIACEQHNNPIIRFNTIYRSGTNGIHFQTSEGTVQYNVIYENAAHGVDVMSRGSIIVEHNIFRDNHPDIGRDDVSEIVSNNNNTSGEGAISYNYNNRKMFDLGYIPGDPIKDKYPYVYPDEDETRRVVKKIGKGLGLTWSVAWDGTHVWTIDMPRRIIYQLDPETGNVIKSIPYPGSWPWGMCFDGKNFWITDFGDRKVYEVDPNTGAMISSFDNPEGITAKGITWDGTYLYIKVWASPNIYKVDKQGNLIEKINADGGGGIAWDGQHFWIPLGAKIGKFDRNGKQVGVIYAASEGTWDLEWDGQYLWACQRTNENWRDAKIFKIEILDDQVALS